MKKTLTLLTVLTVFLAGCDPLFGTKFPTAAIIFAMNLISSIFVLQTAIRRLYLMIMITRNWFSKNKKKKTDGIYCN